MSDYKTKTIKPLIHARSTARSTWSPTSSYDYPINGEWIDISIATNPVDAVYNTTYLTKSGILRSKPRGNNCQHLNIKTFTGDGGSIITPRDYSPAWSNTYSQSFENFCQRPTPEAWALSSQLLSDFERSFDTSSLKEASSFNTLMFLAELDETLFMFTKKFLQQLSLRNSYGAWTWGVQPFIQEATALLETIQKRFDKARPDYQETRKRSDKREQERGVGVVIYAYKETVSIEARRKGDVIYSALDQIPKLLNQFGIYADLNTAWDLVPLSFMIDAFIPFGDLLKAIYPSGNLRSIDFMGWTSIKRTWKVVLDDPSARTQRETNYKPPSGPKPNWEVVLYNRYFQRMHLPVGSRVYQRNAVDWDREARNVFNAFYIGAINRR